MAVSFDSLAVSTVVTNCWTLVNLSVVTIADREPRSYKRFSAATSVSMDWRSPLTVSPRVWFKFMMIPANEFVGACASPARELSSVFFAENCSVAYFVNEDDSMKNINRIKIISTSGVSTNPREQVFTIGKFM